MRNQKYYCYGCENLAKSGFSSVQKKLNHQSSLGFLQLQSLTIIAYTKTDVRDCYTKRYLVRKPNPKIVFTFALPGALNFVLNVLIKMYQAVKPDPPLFSVQHTIKNLTPLHIILI